VQPPLISGALFMNVGTVREANSGQLQQRISHVSN
jgi:hypothetical protein